MPHTTGSGYASSTSVWSDWENSTGYSSNSFVFLLGMLNGAYAVGTPDCISHLAEEIPNPTKYIPLAIAAQMAIGFVTAFPYLIVLFYAVPNLTDVLNNNTASFPLAGLYQAATNSRGGALGLLMLAFLPSVVTCIGCFVTAGRMWWTLARDNAVPGSRYFKETSRRWENPFLATLFCGVLSTALGCIYVGSTTAFQAFVGSFVVLTTISYCAAILPHMLTGRKNLPQGWFWMKGWIGWAVNGIALAYMVVFIIIFCFPYALPTNAKSMNYSCVITGGWTVLVGAFWLVRQKDYKGPPVLRQEVVL